MNIDAMKKPNMATVSPENGVRFYYEGELMTVLDLSTTDMMQLGADLIQLGLRQLRAEKDQK